MPAEDAVTDQTKVTIVCHHCGEEFETSTSSPQFVDGCCDDCRGGSF